MNLRTLASETDALPLDQLADNKNKSKMNENVHTVLCFFDLFLKKVLMIE